MSSRLRINGKPDTCLQATDRGLCYGDGLFETVWLAGGCAPLWPRHMQRLTAGCRRLALPLPDPDRLWHEAEQASAGLEHAVVRITWTRGSGPRGYAPPPRPRATVVVAAHALPEPRADWYHQGLRLHLCQTRLARQPALAGLKHLNRLEQVLARAEWSDPTTGEGLMLDTRNQVISATAANVFAVIDGQLCTPPVDQCGVAGTARAELLAGHPEARVRTLTLPDLLRATEVFLTSAVRGIMPVRALAGREWPVGTCTRTLSAAWHAAGLPPGVRA